MDIETRGLGAGSYPSPREEEYKDVKATVYISLDLQFSVPKKWKEEEIIEDIKENLIDCEWSNRKIDEIEVSYL